MFYFRRVHRQPKARSSRKDWEPRRFASYVVLSHIINLVASILCQAEEVRDRTRVVFPLNWHGQAKEGGKESVLRK